MARMEKYVGTYIQLNHMQSSIVKHANYDTMLHVCTCMLFSYTGFV